LAIGQIGCNDTSVKMHGLKKPDVKSRHFGELAMPNQYCQTVVKEYEAGFGFGQKTLNPYDHAYYRILYDFNV